MNQIETSNQSSLDHLKKTMKQEVSKQISHSLSVSAAFSTVLFLSMFYATPLLRKNPEIVGGTGLLLTFILVAQHLFVVKAQPSQNWSYLFWASLASISLLWGCFTSWVIYEHLISWSTFFVVLISCSVSVNYLAILYPRMELLSTMTSLNLLPPILTCVLFLPGQQGSSFGIFFAAFAGLLLRVGKKQNLSYWENLRSNNRMMAMVESLPGSLIWMDRDKKILGFNRQFEANFSIPQHEQVPNELIDVVDKVYNGESPLQEVRHGRKTSLISGCLYNHGTEAVLMGMDVSSQEVFESELAHERQQVLDNVEHFELGEVFELFTKVLRMSNVDYDINDFQSIFTEEILNVRPVIDWALLLASHEACRPISIEKNNDEHLLSFFTFEPKKLFLGLFHIFKNSVEATDCAENPSISVDLKKVDGEIMIVIEDNGNGIEDGFEDVIYEPFISTKEKHLGLGLSLAKDHLLSFAKVSAENTKIGCKFTVTLVPTQVDQSVA